MFRVGDKVVKNAARWQPSEFDAWGCGVGVGEIVDVLPDGSLDVRWEGGRAWHAPVELSAIATDSSVADDRSGCRARLLG